MARKKNATFQGAGISEIDIDVATFKRVVENIAGDSALIWDIIYNVPSAAAGTSIDHSGIDVTTNIGRGCPLGIPYPCSRFNDEGLVYDISNSYSSTDLKLPLSLYLIPLYWPTGEEYLEIRFPIPFNNDMSDFIDTMPFYATLYQDISGAFTEITSSNFVLESARQTNIDDNIYVARLRALTQNAIHFVSLTTKSMRSAYQLEIKPPIFTWRSQMISTGALTVPNVPGTPYAVGVTNVGGVNAPTFVDFDAARFGAAYPISAAELYYIAQNLNTIEEVLTGSPAGGQSSYSLTSSSDVCFHDHLTNGTNDVAVPLPVWQMGFGATELGYNEADISSKFLDWDAPRIIDNVGNTGQLELMSVLVECDNFANLNTNSKLTFVMIARTNYTNKGAGTYTLKVQMFNSSGSSKTQGSAAFVQFSNSDFAYAKIEALEFWAKDMNRMKIEIAYANMPVSPTSFAAVGAAAWFKV